MATGLEGVAAATAKINELGVKFAAKSLRATVKTALKEAEHRVRARFPVGTEPHYTYRGRPVEPGFALSTLHIEVGFNKRTGAAVATLGVSREAFYIFFTELGTVKMAAAPFFRPGFEEAVPAMTESVASELKERAESVARKQAGGP